jgi:hypothetical protein
MRSVAAMALPNAANPAAVIAALRAVVMASLVLPLM